MAVVTIGAILSVILVLVDKRPVNPTSDLESHHSARVKLTGATGASALPLMFPE